MCETRQVSQVWLSVTYAYRMFACPPLWIYLHPAVDFATSFTGVSRSDHGRRIRLVFAAAIGWKFRRLRSVHFIFCINSAWTVYVKAKRTPKKHENKKQREETQIAPYLLEGNARLDNRYLLMRVIKPSLRRHPSKKRYSQSKKRVTGIQEYNKS